MSKWYYTNEKDERVCVTGGQLKGLAKAGLITPETIVETADGKTAPARKVKGLTFLTALPTDSPSSDVVLSESSSPITMANFYYIDANGRKQGPRSFRQIQEMIPQGIITPTTPLETDTGHRGVAGQFPGLFPATLASVAQPVAPVAPVVSLPPSVPAHATIHYWRQGLKGDILRRFALKPERGCLRMSKQPLRNC